MDGRGRWVDNVFVERLWRSVKYEDVYLKAYETIGDVRQGLREYFDMYNGRRRHQGQAGGCMNQGSLSLINRFHLSKQTEPPLYTASSLSFTHTLPR
jgi:hypothetical protein